MIIKEAREHLNKNGIYQLNKGESLKDALDHLEHGTSRKGYKVKHDNGQMMTENQIIQNENKIAFSKMVSPKEFVEDEVEDIDDITDGEDYRDNKKERGIIVNCYYCGTCIRTDGDVEEVGDYPDPEDTAHCDGCMNNAIARLAM